MTRRRVGARLPGVADDGASGPAVPEIVPLRRLACGPNEFVVEMYPRRSLLLAALVLAPCAVAPGVSAQVAPLAAPVAFITQLGNQALAVIAGGASLQDKMAYFHTMLRQDFDLAGTAPFVLGPYWRVATEAERAEFVRLLEDYIVATFGRRLYDAGGVALRVTGSRGTQFEPIVISEIQRQGGPPMRLEWVLNSRTGAYRIGDINLDGVSMALTQRQEFAAMLARGGGTIASLLAQMRQIIAAQGV